MNRGKRAAPETRPRHRFTMAPLRGERQPELSKKLFKMIKTENHVIDAYESAGRDRISVASQLSEWGESTGDAAISDISDKLGVVLAELGEQEDAYAQNLEDSRNILKHIRNTESSVQPARDHKTKLIDEIQRYKQRDPGSSKVTTLEQELVRAEAQVLVAEAQLTNMTRQKFKESYDMQLAATIERAEKQIILARHGRRILNLLDDTPLVPGEARRSYEGAEPGKQILEDAEQELRTWEPSVEPIRSSAHGVGPGMLPTHRREDADGDTYTNGGPEEMTYQKETRSANEPGGAGA
ncbi:meiotic expression up-regulated protein 14 [Coccidioides immitis RMSCC 3703]|uniref:Meiotic expression up-regulated protein 14 n=1 Tax=Coccidioides immitis RMSCC 3703 TaxID=454286 RepID=A0A0J8QNB0_COCIT|nr:meiotic expression up-regulated protein 14 [Coccidioides immitis RMSCC 3703]